MNNILITIGTTVGGFVLGVLTCAFVGHRYESELVSWYNGRQDDANTDEK